MFRTSNSRSVSRAVVDDYSDAGLARNYAAEDCADDDIDFHRDFARNRRAVSATNIYSNEDSDELDTNEGSSADTPLIREVEDDGTFPKARHIFGFMGFLGFAVVYAMRVNLSVAIVAMVNQTAIPEDNSTSVDDTCPVPKPTNNTTPTKEGEFVWDEATQGLVLGSFFYGYVLTQVPGGRLAELMGGKLIYGFGVLITAIFTLLTPIAAYWDLPMLVLVRVLEGMGEGVTYPAMHAMLAHWIPPLERNKFAAIVYAGSNIGTVISMPLAGWLCSLDFLGGWPSAFYIFGLLGIVWFAFWMYLVYDKPSVHPRISLKERDYIERSLRAMQPRNNSDLLSESDVDVIHTAAEEIPWRSIFTSLPLWAILITQCGQSWAFYTQLTELPTYMSNILHFDIQSNAVLNAIPYFTSWIVGIVCSGLADWMLERRYISQLNSYKLWNSIASIIPSIGLLATAYVGCSWIWVTVMLAGVGSFGGAVYAGNQMNHIALSPRYAGTMYGLTNSAANICGFLAPYVIGLIINHHETLAQWRIVFWLAAAVNIGGNFMYLIFASATEQSWSRIPHLAAVSHVRS
ncbi:PREDICTED: sialin [Rhagoletis zephyria]|uniref:sialin n=1 Tax=Rhagoletis zephyria TaxID=28612 RepID=UPI00081122DE|nr:PREDICTED: sialin [Rhagoletis zephyria]XP_036341633.1 sialin-like [Rhagoletis pomonella]XP_036341653.1 sialin-like [Rhagoletis pomonella]